MNSLISTEELNNILNIPGLIILDVSPHSNVSGETAKHPNLFIT